MSVHSNPDFDTDILRYNYESFTTPSSVIDFNMKTQNKEIKKEQEVLGGKFDKNNYKCERIWATARDGAKIPISIVYHKNTKQSKDTPLLLYGYGSYGYTLEDRFSTTRLSLLNRGFIFAVAHVRGSQYLGRDWYENGKLLKKKNTFFDFIDAGKYLVEKNYTSSKHLYAEGGSAGGLLMGAIVNYNANLFNGVIAAVPFVDVLTTMLDDTIPLTTGEYDEWGNPNKKEYYDYIKSYSPYDKVTQKKYPNMLVTTGLHDSQVQYFEPAKWVAKLRELKKDNNILLLHTDMKVGHGGASGRFNALKDIAKDYSFLLDLEGVIK
jgi:oligopeptidase B